MQGASFPVIRVYALAARRFASVTAIRALAQSLTCPHGVKAFVGRDPADSRDVGQRQYDVLSSGQAVGRVHSGSRYRRWSRLDLRIRKDAKVPSKDPC
jgi:hypothetical protein